MTSTHPTTLGLALSTAELPGFRITESVYRPRERLPTHTHEHPALTLLVDGWFRESCGSRSYDCLPGSVLVRPGGESHENLYGPGGARCLLVEAIAARPEVRLFDEVGYAPPRATGHLVPLLYREFRTRDDVSPLALEGLCLELVAALARYSVSEKTAHVPRWLRLARELLRDRFNEPLRLGEIAAEVGVHPSQLARAFRREFGSTPSAYVRRRRVEWARRELLRSERSLAEIALDAGFADQSHFTRVFTRIQGVSPLRYRKKG